MARVLNVCAAALSLASLHAQLPETDLWLFKIRSNKQKHLTLTDPVNITNRKGYDNQPSFSGDDRKIYYVSVRADNQADIYAYDLKRKKHTQLTRSKESEYSPVPTPGSEFISSVVVEQDSTQRIYFLDPVTGIALNRFEFDSVGYYTFLNKDTVIYYKLTGPHSLRSFSARTGEDKWLGNSPIRGFRPIDRHTLLYGLKDSSGVTFYTYDFLLHKGLKYAQYPSPGEDVTWHPEWGLLKSEDSRILRFDAKKKEWIVLFDATDAGIKKITRFTFDSKNKFLVLVNNL